MKKELKLLGKYIGLSVLITVFVLQLFTTIVSKISAYNDLKYFEYENMMDNDVVEHFRFIEDHSYTNFLETCMRISRKMEEAGFKDYPAIGTMIQFYETSRIAYSGLYELGFYISLGVLIGIVYYLCKKEFKKLPHYIFVFGLMFIIICMLIVMYSYISQLPFFGSFELDWEILGETMRDSIKPYTIICIIIYIAICLIGKKKTELLNKEINKNK